MTLGSVARFFYLNPYSVTIFCLSSGFLWTNGTHDAYGMSVLEPAWAGREPAIGTDERESSMLVLSRKLGEKIVIGDNIIVTIVKIDRNQIRVGIEAPHDVPVYREEILPARAGKISDPSTALSH
jgi:carbon storage regulator